MLPHDRGSGEKLSRHRGTPRIDVSAAPFQVGPTQIHKIFVGPAKLTLCTFDLDKRFLGVGGERLNEA